MIFEEKHIEAAKELVYKMADDQLIIGHRNSEWTGLGPLLEEDIAFSSMAQDKIGQSFHLYSLLTEMGEQDPDTVAFTRNEKQFHCCKLVELPIGEYDFSLVRHFLFDHAEQIRFNLLAESTLEPLQMMARKFKGEIKYHILHADTWLRQLATGSEESKARIQSALNYTFSYGLGIFEHGPYEDLLAESGIFKGEEALKTEWLETIGNRITNAGYNLPDIATISPEFGGRKGYHTEYLQPLLTEMTEVFSIDPSAEW